MKVDVHLQLKSNLKWPLQKIDIIKDKNSYTSVNYTDF